MFLWNLEILLQDLMTKYIFGVSVFEVLMFIF